VSDLTITDLFCGAGGSSLGAEMAGATLRLGLNHWRRAIETHAENFEHADHDCADISALTTTQIRRYPDSDILLASPECTNHSIAKGGKRVKPQAASLWEDGPAGDAEQERSRSTMWDVVRFTEQKRLKGRPYKAIVVENVVDAFKWGLNDDGGLFDSWLGAMQALGYRHEIVWLNSMFAPPTPQSRDRMYVVFWKDGVKKPNLKVEPPCWCPACEKIVPGQQTWKKVGTRPWGRYGAQYLYGCPNCHGTAIPGVATASSAIDYSLEAPLIGDRDKPLAEKTRERIRRGLERLGSEPFAIRLLQSGNPRPLTLPLVTLTARHDLAMVLPVAGNTFERTPGNRARNGELQPMDTIHGTLERAMVLPFVNNNNPTDAELEPVHTVKARGFHHGIVVANYRPGWSRRAEEQPFGSLTTKDGHSLVMPYYGTDQRPKVAERDPASTVSTKDRMALLIPEGEQPAAFKKTWSDTDIDKCGFRMFSLPEIARTMQMHEHQDGGEYVVTGNKREQMAQYGNAVTPPAMRLLVGRLAEALS